MQRTVTAQTARQRLGELLEGVYYRGDEVIIERAGRPMGVVIPVARYRQNQEARERFFRKFDELRAQGSDLDPEEAERIAVEEIRALRQEKRQAAQAG